MYICVPALATVSGHRIEELERILRSKGVVTSEAFSFLSP